MGVKHITGSALVTAATAAILVAGCRKQSPAASASPDPLNSLTTANFNHRLSGSEIAAMAPMLIEQLRAFPDSYDYENSGLDRSQIEVLRQNDRLTDQQKERIQSNLVILGHALTVGDENVRKAALYQLGKMDEYGQAALPAICKALSDSNTEVRLAAAEALDDMYSADLGAAAIPLAETAINSKGRLQDKAADALDYAAGDVELASTELIDLVITLLDAKDKWVVMNAIDALEELASKGNVSGAVPKLVNLAKNGHSVFRDDALELIAEVNPIEFPLKELGEILDEPSPKYGDTPRAAAHLAAKIGPTANPLSSKLIAILFDERGTGFLVPQAVGQALHAIAPEKDYSRELLDKSFSESFPIKCSIGIALTECDGPNLTTGVRLLEMVYRSRLANHESRKRAAYALSNLEERAAEVVQPQTLINIANKVGLGRDFYDSYANNALRALRFFEPTKKILGELDAMAGFGQKCCGSSRKEAVGHIFSAWLEKIQGQPEFKELQEHLEHNLAMMLGEMSSDRADSILKAIEEKHPQLLTHYEVEKYKKSSEARQKKSSSTSAYICDALRASLRDVVELLARH